jgi:MFS family permease
MGALASTSVGNPLGRRRAPVVFAIIAAVGVILQGSPFSLGQLIVGRIISGIGVRGVNAVVPVWQSRVLKAEESW